MNSNKFIPILGLLILLILAIGSISASDVDSDSIIGDSDANIDLTATQTAVNEIDNSAIDDDVTAQDIITDAQDDDMVSDDISGIDDVEKGVGVENSLGASQDSEILASTIQFTESKYSTYFNGSGNIISGKLKSGDILDFSGKFTNKTFVINLPLIITSTDRTVNLIDCQFKFISGSDESKISNMKMSNHIIEKPAMYLTQVNDITLDNNNIYSNATGAYPMLFERVNRLNIINNSIQSTCYIEGWGHPSGIVFRNAGFCNVSGNNVITNDSVGIYFTTYAAVAPSTDYPSNNNYIFNNTIHSSRQLPSSFAYGIKVQYSDNLILNNTVYNYFRGISSDGAFNQIIGNNISNIHGTYYSQGTTEQGGDFAIYATVGCLIKDNLIQDCICTGSDSTGGTHSVIRVGRDSNVTNNTLKNIEGMGAILEGNNINFIGNDLNITSYGVYICGDIYNVVISENNISTKKKNNIKLEKASRVKIPHDFTIINNVLYNLGAVPISVPLESTNIVMEPNTYIIDGIIDEDTYDENVHYIYNSNFDNYFSDSGYLENYVKENDTLLFMGDFSAKGTLFINQKVNIKGLEAQFDDTTFIIVNDDVCMENIKISNPNKENKDRLWGIQVNGVKNVTIKNCDISIYDPYSAYAIYILGASNCSVINNTLQAKGDYFTASILLFNSSDIFMDGNTIKTIGTGELYLINNQSCLDGYLSVCIDACLDGSTLCPDGSIVCPDGSMICPDGSIVCADGSIVCPDGSIVCPDGTIINYDESNLNPDGSICIDGTTYYQNGTVEYSDGTVIEGSASFVLDGVIPGSHMVSGLYRTYGALFIHSSNITFINNKVNVTSALSANYDLNESYNTIAGLFVHYGGFNNNFSNNEIILQSNDPVIYGMGIIGASPNSSAVGSKNNNFTNNNLTIIGPYHGVGIVLGYKAIDSCFANNNIGIYTLYYHMVINYTGSENNIIESNTLANKINSTLSISNASYKFNNLNKIITITIKDSNGKVLVNKEIYVILNGETFKVKSDKNGLVTVKVTLNAVKTYDIIVKFEGDIYNFASSATGKITVTKDSTSLSSSGKTYAVTATPKAITVTLRDASGNLVANRKISATVNGKTYTATTNSKGVATIKLSLTAVKTYTVNLKFAGDSYYTASTKSIKVKVTKTKTKLTVPKKTYKRSAKVKKLTATLKDQFGKVIKSKKVTFTVNGKKYTAKTNKKGVATVKVKLSKKKTYKVTVKFAGDKTYYAVKKTGKVVIK